ncbi:MAG: hypothetical protein WCX97_05115 [Candidatus Magasanikbacteria bacterium]
MTTFKKLDKNLLGYIIGVGLLLFFFIFLITGTQIGYDVKKRCQSIQKQYGGECVEVLMKQVADTNTSYGKNDAIWALGQLGDKRAIQFLKTYDNGQPLPEHESWNEGVSQYELRKAIKLLESDFNISSLVWR